MNYEYQELGEKYDIYERSALNDERGANVECVCYVVKTWGGVVKGIALSSKSSQLLELILIR